MLFHRGESYNLPLNSTNHNGSSGLDSAFAWLIFVVQRVLKSCSPAFNIILKIMALSQVGGTFSSMMLWCHLSKAIYWR